MDVKKFWGVLRDSLKHVGDGSLERLNTRPWFYSKERVLNGKIWWFERTAISDGWIVQSHVLNSQLMRLIHEPSKRFVGWSTDEGFLVNELFRLVTEPSGYVGVLESNRSVFKIAHISDTHVCWRGGDTLEGRANDLRVLTELYESVVGRSVDFICVTGDVTDNGLGYMKFLDVFRGFVESGSMFAVPGNHDLCSLGGTPLAGSFKYDDWSSFSRLLMGEGNASCFAFRRGPFAFLGIDSSDFKNSRSIADNARGRVSSDDIESLRVRFRSLGVDDTVPFRVLMIHHHVVEPSVSDIDYGFMSPGSLNAIHLQNVHDVMKLVREFGVTHVLHGHKHVGYNVDVDGVRVVSTPSSTMDRRYNEMTFDVESGHVELEVVEF